MTTMSNLLPVRVPEKAFDQTRQHVAEGLGAEGLQIVMLEHAVLCFYTVVGVSHDRDFRHTKRPDPSLM